MTDINQSAGNRAQLAGRDINNNFDADAVETILSHRPSHVAKVITALACNLPAIEEPDRSVADPYGIQEKIDFNNVIEYREVFERYAGFGSVIDGVCDNLDVDVPDIKRKLFDFIKTEYLLKKGSLQKEEINLQDHSDDVITAIRTKLKELVVQDFDTIQISTEDIDLSIMALVTKAFIDCKLLEHPPTS